MNPTFDAVVVISAWIGGGLITYGTMRTTLVNLQRELKEVKQSVKELEDKSVRRDEYNHRHADILRNLDRIENKIDRMEAHT